jgi:hypothetical protein
LSPPSARQTTRDGYSALFGSRPPLGRGCGEREEGRAGRDDAGFAEGLRGCSPSASARGEPSTGRVGASALRAGAREAELEERLGAGRARFGGGSDRDEVGRSPDLPRRFACTRRSGGATWRTGVSQ